MLYCSLHRLLLHYYPSGNALGLCKLCGGSFILCLSVGKYRYADSHIFRSAFCLLAIPCGNEISRVLPQNLLLGGSGPDELLG